MIRASVLLMLYVRELRNAVSRALSLVEAFDRAYCEAALAATGGNLTKAAELAGVNRKYLQRHQALGMREDD